MTRARWFLGSLVVLALGLAGPASAGAARQGQQAQSLPAASQMFGVFRRPLQASDALTPAEQDTLTSWFADDTDVHPWRAQQVGIFTAIGPILTQARVIRGGAIDPVFVIPGEHGMCLDMLCAPYAAAAKGLGTEVHSFTQDPGIPAWEASYDHKFLWFVPDGFDSVVVADLTFAVTDNIVSGALPGTGDGPLLAQNEAALRYHNLFVRQQQRRARQVEKARAKRRAARRAAMRSRGKR